MGTLIHATLEDLNRFAIAGRYDEITEELIKKWFALNYAKMQESTGLMLSEERRKSALGQVLNYFDKRKEHIRKVWKAEEKVELVLPEYILQGVIDLIEDDDGKIERILQLYLMLYEGKAITKSDLATRFDVNEKTIQRDIEDIRAFLDNKSGGKETLLYDRSSNRYRIVLNDDSHLTNSEILTVCKILLESRSMVKDEMYPIIDKLLECCVPSVNKKKVSELIANEKFLYNEPHHKKKFIDAKWDICSAVYEHRLMKICYKKLKNPDNVMRLIQPVGVMFSEYYFYLCAYISVSEEMPDVPKRPFPTIYRIDRIEKHEILDEHFHVAYSDRFQEGEFRKRIQFMFGGELRTVKFLYKGISIEAVLDRFPTANIIKHDENGWLIKAEIYGDGVDIRLRGQGDIIEVIDDGKRSKV